MNKPAIRTPAPPPRRATGLALLTALSLAVSAGALGAACGSSGGATGSTGASTTGGAGGGAGAPATAYCNNASDEAARTRGYCPGNQSIDQIAGNCGLHCLTTADAGGCVQACIVQATSHAISDDCASCVADTVACARTYCLEACLTNTQGVQCLACRCGGNGKKHNCYDDYSQCSGTHLPDCEELEAGTFHGYPMVDAGCP